jgi:SAM-dependent methyltransferase
VSSYIFDHGWDHERRRLDLLEQVFDLGTQAHLGRIPLPAGGHCLEVGAGAGSIAQWLCDRVGPDGRVVATDIDTGFLEPLTEKNLEVRRHDIVRDDLEERAFDLVHARLVLEHLPQRDRVLERLVTALRPGGWLILEDFDWGSLAVAPGCVGGDILDRFHEGIRLAFAAAGYRHDYGLVLPLAPRSAGIVDIGAEGRTYLGVPGTPAAAWWQLTLERFRPAVVEQFLLLTDAEVDEIVALLDDEGFCFQYPTLVTTWGRRPLGGQNAG